MKPLKPYKTPTEGCRTLGSVEVESVTNDLIRIILGSCQVKEAKRTMIKQESIVETTKLGLCSANPLWRQFTY